MVVRLYIKGIISSPISENLGISVTALTKVIAIAMQMLDRKPAEEPVLTVQEQPIGYEA
jgi:hypothetical protein